MSNRDNPSVIRGINHVGLTVPDMDQATDFLQKALNAKFVYDGLTASDEPGKGADLERQVGFSSGILMIKQRLLRIGNGAHIELFEIASDKQSKPAGLQDFGWNHIFFYVDDITMPSSGSPLPEGGCFQKSTTIRVMRIRKTVPACIFSRRGAV